MKKLTLFFCVVVVACTSIPPLSERLNLAEKLVRNQRWEGIDIPAGKFVLRAYLPSQISSESRLTIYIEGDGFSWLTSDQPSDNPTPIDPKALRLALAQPDGKAAYLSRPCQYVVSDCSGEYWTDRRFSSEVISAMDIAVESLKTRLAAKRLILVGYSGGGSVAVLIAAQRTDVDRLITVAGNLDHQEWTKLHRIHPLEGSLNPTDRISDLVSVRQQHLVGAKDSNITPELVRNFADRFPYPTRPSVRVFENFDHQCCWAENWKEIWNSLE